METGGEGLTMDAERLAEIRAMAEAATPGPWIVVQRGDDASENFLIGFGRDSQIAQDIYITTDHLHASESNGASALDDATFTAQARQVIPELLGEMDRLKAELHSFQVIASSRYDLLDTCRTALIYLSTPDQIWIKETRYDYAARILAELEKL